MSESKGNFKVLLLVAGVSALAYYFFGPVGLGVLALYFLLKGKF